jgi:hypothetical protein
MIRALPKRLQKLVAANPDKIEVGHSEQDDFNGPRTWSHWIYLRKGWHNASVDPMPGQEAQHALANHPVLGPWLEEGGDPVMDCQRVIREAEDRLGQ